MHIIKNVLCSRSAWVW